MPSGKKLLDRSIAIAAGILLGGFSLLFSLIAEREFEVFLRVRLGVWIFAKQNYPLVVDYLRVGLVFLAAYPVAVALTVVALLWNGWKVFWKRLTIYVLLLLIAGPIVLINYANSDQWLNLWVQSALNVLVAFLAYTVVLGLRKTDGTSPDLRAFQSLAILLITAILIALPLFYTALFLSFSLGILDINQIHSINDKLPLAVAGLAGSLGLLLKNLDALRGISTSKTD